MSFMKYELPSRMKLIPEWSHSWPVSSQQNLRKQHEGKTGHWTNRSKICYYTTQLPLFHRHPTQSIISQSISESLSALQGYTVWVDCNLVQIIQLQMPPYIRLNSKHLYKIWSEREAVLMCKNVLKWMVSNFISPMLRLLPSFEGRGGCSHAA